MTMIRPAPSFASLNSPWTAGLAVTLLGLGLSFACGSTAGGGETTTDSTDASGTTADPSVTTSPSTSATTSATTASTTDPTSMTSTSLDTSSDGSESTGGPPAEPAIHWVGRIDTSDPTRTRFGWSGAGFVVRFDGTGVSTRLDDAARYFTLVVDGTVQPTVATAGGEQDFVLATGLTPGEHVVEFYRRTEGSFGPSSVLSIDIEGELLAPPAVTRRMEIIGDSITCGYGNEGIAPCSFSAETENST